MEFISSLHLNVKSNEKRDETVNNLNIRFAGIQC